MEGGQTEGSVMSPSLYEPEKENILGSFGAAIGSPRKHQSEKQDNNMYPFNDLGFSLADIEDRNRGILQKLTLFAPFNHENDTLMRGESCLESAPSKPSSAVKDSTEQIKELRLERPVTPIDQEIRAPPSSFQRLAKLVRRRIVPKPGISHLDLDDQKELAAIIMGEVNGIWANIRMQVADPFLSEEENSELQRRITVHVVTVCEQLFIHYLQKAQILNKRGIFSGPANMSRLKTQLSLDANKFLNILTIRRYIVGDLKCHRDSQGPTDNVSALSQQQPPLLSYKGLIEASRPKPKAQPKPFGNTQENIEELEEMMPDLNTDKLLDLLSEIPLDRIPSKLTDGPTSSHKTPSKLPINRQSSSDLSRDKLLFRKSESVPLLSYGETLREELGLSEGRESKLSLLDEDGGSSTRGSTHTHEQQQTEVAGAETQRGTWEYQQADLHNLMSRGLDKDVASSEDDLPPLLQASVSSDKQEQRQRQIEQRLRHLEALEQRQEEENRVEKRQPSHPQPSTVSSKLPNQMLVRTSDIRVSDRVCLSSITLSKHNTVYNDLIDEIDPSIVKQLDSNLSLGDEITEVYTEIMKTVPTDHLLMDNDDMIEATAESLNLGNALASSTLHRPPNERIINRKLRQRDEPPWGGQDINDWAKLPLNPNGDGQDPSSVANAKTVGSGPSELSGGIPPHPGAPTGVNVGAPPEIMARSYASWLAWWKNTINSDDYMKYLSTQDSDYLGAIFHFYNSDDEDEDVESLNNQSRSTKRSRQLQQEAKEKRLEELRTEKTSFTDGFWNANAVLMGGLGQEPSVDEEVTDTETRTIPPADSEVSSSHGAGTLGRPPRSAAIISQRSLRRERTRDGAGSLPSRSAQESQAEGKMRAAVSSDQGDTRSPQERLEKVWSHLKMPDHLKLDMAIKYSSDRYHSKLTEAIEGWEEAAELILQREALIGKLEEFERLASDPNRFFEKGQRGSSVARLEEARMRSLYYKKIESTHEQLNVLLAHLRREYQDIITYEGRPYVDKMQWDRTEMLYWLQEERKVQALEYESQLRQSLSMSGAGPAGSVRLAPIEPMLSGMVK